MTTVGARKPLRAWQLTKIIVRGVLAYTLLILFGIGGLTLVRLVDAPVSNTERPGGGSDSVARVRDHPGACERHGPLSLSGAGYYWECYGRIARPGGLGDERLSSGRTS